MYLNLLIYSTSKKTNRLFVSIVTVVFTVENYFRSTKQKYAHNCACLVCDLLCRCGSYLTSLNPSAVAQFEFDLKNINLKERHVNSRDISNNQTVFGRVGDGSSYTLDFTNNENEIVVTFEVEETSNVSYAQVMILSQNLDFIDVVEAPSEYGNVVKGVVCIPNLLTTTINFQITGLPGLNYSLTVEIINTQLYVSNY